VVDDSTLSLVVAGIFRVKIGPTAV